MINVLYVLHLLYNTFFSLSQTFLSLEAWYSHSVLFEEIFTQESLPASFWWNAAPKFLVYSEIFFSRRAAKNKAKFNAKEETLQGPDYCELQTVKAPNAQNKLNFSTTHKGIKRVQRTYCRKGGIIINKYIII